MKSALHYSEPTGDNSPILACIDWSNLNELVEREQKRRESHTPVISLYRWWARRPHSLIGGILDAAVKTYNSRVIRVADPFSGGGTVALESAMRKIPVYAQDLYPWPTFSLATSLTTVTVEEFKEGVKDLIQHLERFRHEFRRADGRELTHVLRVRIGCCPTCAREVFLYPYSMFSLASRKKGELYAYFGCRRCGYVTKEHRDTRRFSCPECKWQEPEGGPSRRGFVACPHCGDVVMQQSFYKETLVWKAVLVQESIIQNGRSKALVRKVEPGDPVETATASEDCFGLNARIDDGIETRRLLHAGFQVWGDLYTTRQARVLLESLRYIRDMDVSDGCRDRLALAVIGAAEMAAFLSRWDRYHLKAYEGLANHRYAHTTMTVETNLLGPLGRGTLINRLKSAVRAVEWTSSYLPRGGVGVQVVDLDSQVDLNTNVLIALGDSAHQALSSRSVDIVLTDPPYFNDVQYGELARLFHYWLGHYREIPRADEGKEAVPNSRRGNGADFYEIAITNCLRESERTLRKGGKLILTYHNRKFQAWLSLARALVESGFVVQAVAVARAENSADITKRNGRGILYDLVLECERRSESTGQIETFVAGESDEERELLAMGIAFSEVLQQAEPDELLNLYESNLQRFDVLRRFISCGGTRSFSRQSP